MDLCVRPLEKTKKKKTKKNLKQPTAAASARIIMIYFQIFRDLLRCWLHLHLSSCHGRCLIYRLSRLYNIVKQSFVIILGESSDRSFVRSFRLINSAAHTHSHKDPSTRFSTIDLQYFACNLFVAFVFLFRFLFFFCCYLQNPIGRGMNLRFQILFKTGHKNQIPQTKKKCIVDSFFYLDYPIKV